MKSDKGCGCGVDALPLNGKSIMKNLFSRPAEHAGYFTPPVNVVASNAVHRRFMP